MRTETTTRILRQWHELDEETQEKALEGLYDVNVDHEWWGFTYEDAERIGLTITEFDIGRGAYVKGTLMGSTRDTIKKIWEEHGKGCETYQTACEYWQLRKEQGDGKYGDLDSWEEDFLYALCEDYRVMLQQEYEYLTSREAIVETIEANEWEFDEEGKLG